MSSEFRECVIIPLAMFERCNFRDSKQQPQDKASDILYNQDLPSGLKMKLYHQHKKLIPVESGVQKVEIIEQKTPVKHQLAADVDSIVQEFSSKKVPPVRSILDKILQNRDNVRWNEKLELIINGSVLPGTNIIDVLRYAVGETVLTSDLDVPLGAKSFLRTLKDIGVPGSWLKKKSAQVGSGWIFF